MLSAAPHQVIKSLRQRPPTHVKVGFNLLSAHLSLQKCRPWHMDGKSNKAVDNAVTLEELFKGRRVALFGVPAPFTGTCTTAHVPPYNKHADAFASKVDELICYTVADPHCHHNWAKSMGVDTSKLSFMCDPTGEVASAWGVEKEYNASSLGRRSERFSMLVDDGKVVSFQLVDDAAKDAEVLLSQC